MATWHVTRRFVVDQTIAVDGVETAEEARRAVDDASERSDAPRLDEVNHAVVREQPVHRWFVERIE